MVLLMLLCGCMSEQTTTTTITSTTTTTTTTTVTSTTMANPPTANRIDNKFFPLKPGTKFTYRALTADGKELIETYVTNQTKVILNVTCVVVRDTATLEGKLEEETIDWYAQDKEGNVWYFGEDSKEYKSGVVVSTKGSWEAGVDGAKEGIIMKADPKAGDVYQQEYYKGEAEDMAEVLKLGESVSVPYGSFSNCLVTREWTPLEPGKVTLKYYASGIGLVKETMVKGGKEQVELVNITIQ